jgi:malic enzyme
VVTSGFVNGMKLQKTDLADARVVFYGAGSSAVGVAEMIATYMEQVQGVRRGAAKLELGWWAGRRSASGQQAAA